MEFFYKYVVETPPLQNYYPPMPLKILTLSIQNAIIKSYKRKGNYFEI